MTGKFYRRIACLAATLGLGVASSPSMQTAAAASAVTAVAGATNAASAASVTPTPAQDLTGNGWGSMIGCAACAVAAGIIIAGGPGAVLAAANAPGSAIAVLACGATCYEAFQ
jgi:hypothetical protein